MPDRPIIIRACRKACISRPNIDAFELWLAQSRARVSAKSPTGEALKYIAKYWDGLILFLDDGRIELDSNPVERTIRPIALNRNYAHHVIMRSSLRDGPQVPTGWRFSTQRTAHKSKVLKELHQLVRWPIPTGARSDRLQAIKGALLH